MGPLEPVQEDRYIFPEENQSPTHTTEDEDSRYDQLRPKYEDLRKRFEELLKEHRKIFNEINFVQNALGNAVRFVSNQDEIDKDRVQQRRLVNKLLLLQAQRKQLLPRLEETKEEFRQMSEEFEKEIYEASSSHWKKMREGKLNPNENEGETSQQSRGNLN